MGIVLLYLQVEGIDLPISGMRTLRLREMTWFVHSYSAQEEQSWASNPGLRVPSPNAGVSPRVLQSGTRWLALQCQWALLVDGSSHRLRWDQKQGGKSAPGSSAQRQLQSGPGPLSRGVALGGVESGREGPREGGWCVGSQSGAREETAGEAGSGEAAGPGDREKPSGPPPTA